MTLNELGAALCLVLLFRLLLPYRSHSVRNPHQPPRFKPAPPPAPPPKRSAPIQRGYEKLQ